MDIHGFQLSAAEQAVCDVAIVGAGPYGLSLAAHLRSTGVSFRIFGPPMENWRSHMPIGMMLKSDGFASNLYEPSGQFTLKQFCADRGIEYSDKEKPVSLETFCAYGLAFVKKFVPQLEPNLVESVRTATHGFTLKLDSGETVAARRVVLAVGITHFPFVPENLSHLPGELLSHSWAHRDLTPFVGKKVVVVGGGASAINLAYMLHDAGAKPEMVLRDESLIFSGKPQTKHRSLLQKLRYPPSGLGDGWRSRFCTDAPLLFYHLPRSFRHTIVRRHLGPAGAWHSESKVVGQIPVHSGSVISQACEADGRVQLTLESADTTHGKTSRQIQADHVICATGYRADINRLRFLSGDIRSCLRTQDNTPILSTKFESSVPGLYFTGLSAANSFGPMLRFAYGAGFTARRLTRALGRNAVRRSGAGSDVSSVAGVSSGVPGHAI